MKRIYTRNFEKTENRLKEPIETFEPGQKEYEDIYALPLIANSAKNLVKGGLCNHNFDRSGISQKDFFFCKSSYFVDETNLKICEEPVVFGGVFVGQFGLMLVLSMSRLWWVLENPDDTRKIVFLLVEGDETAKKNCHNMMSLLGIDVSKYEIIEEPTIFKKILVPEETWLSRSKISKKMFLPHKKIVERLFEKYPEETPKKIYFSRARFSRPNQDPDGINEEYYENFYKRRGFEIVYPEKLPLEKQIRLLAGADEYVSTFGTLAHFGTMFLKDGAKQVMLQRDEKLFNWFFIQLFLVEFRELDWYLIEATKNLYPTHHDGGVFFYYPTDYFKEYLNDNKIVYDDDELIYEPSPEEISEYNRRWLSVYSKPRIFKFLKKPELFPVLQALYYQSTGKLLNPKDYLE